MAFKAQAADMNNMSEDDVRGQLRKARQLIEKLLNEKSDQHKGTQTEAEIQSSKKKFVIAAISQDIIQSATDRDVTNITLMRHHRRGNVKMWGQNLPAVQEEIPSHLLLLIIWFYHPAQSCQNEDKTIDVLP